MRVIVTVDDYQDMMAYLSNGVEDGSITTAFCDIENNDLDPYVSTFILLSIKAGDETFVIDYSKLGIYYLGQLAGFLREPRVTKVFHNAVYDCKHIYHNTWIYGNPVRVSPVYCTLVHEQILKAGLLMNGFGLDDVAERRLGITMDKKVRDGFIHRNPFISPITQEEYEYSARDSDVLEEIYYQQLKELVAEGQQRVSELECELLPITSKMEYEGVSINRAKLEEAGPVIQRIMDKAGAEIQDEIIRAGAANEILFDRRGYTAANVDSTKQMLHVFNTMGINVGSLSKKEISDWDGQWAKRNRIKKEDIGGDDDMHIGYAHPLLRKHAIFKAASKIKGTYVDGLLERINPVTGRIHPHFNQCGAVATGRYSSSQPNYQNIPNYSRMEALGLQEYNIRSMFIASEGYDFIISDYQGIELAILAAMSGDKNLTEQILRGDVHSFVANSLEGEKIKSLLGDQINANNRKSNVAAKEIRDQFKKVSFGIVYGSTGYNLYRTLYFTLASYGLVITQADADRWVEDWKGKLFPQTGALLNRNSQYAVTRFYTESILGRRRRWPVDIRRDKWRTLAAQREGMNQPIQSSSADITKLGMVLVDANLDPSQARIVATVHDELLIESKKEYTEEAIHITKYWMEEAARRLFPNVDPMLFQCEPKVSDKYDK